MADCDCDFCGTRNEECPYAYTESDCPVETIKAAKAVVDDDFYNFLFKIENKNKELCDDGLETLIWRLKHIIRDSVQPLPDWAIKED